MNRSRLLCRLLFCICMHSGSLRAAPASPAADAAERADWPQVIALLSQKTDPGISQTDGTTALHWACHHDNAAAVQALLDAGADASAANEFGVKPLSLACGNGSEPIVRALLKAGADAATASSGGETALHTAARTGQPGAVAALLEHGAPVDALDRKQQTPLMWAAAEGHGKVVSQLIDAGADRDRRTKAGFTALLFAAREGRTGAVRTLLKAGSDAGQAIQTERAAGRGPGNGTSALLLAVENGHYELALELVKAGADANDARSGFTPLHALTFARRPPRGDDLDGQPPPEGSGSITSLQFAERLIAAGAAPDFQLSRGGKAGFTLKGATPFFLAARHADLELMQLLVRLGADPLLPNGDGATPLMVAAGLGCYAPDEEAGTERECIAAVSWLLERGADVNTVDRNGDTAMHGAAFKNLPEMVKFLASKGAKISVWNQKDKSGRSPITIAEGFRPGNFKPSRETLEALRTVMKEAGITPPPATPRKEDK